MKVGITEASLARLIRRSAEEYDLDIDEASIGDLLSALTDEDEEDEEKPEVGKR